MDATAEKGLKELAKLFATYSEHLGECEVYNDKSCTCGFDLAKSEWQEKYGLLDELAAAQHGHDADGWESPAKIGSPTP